MSTQEIIDNLCKSKGHKKSKIEDELELGRGYLSRVKNPSLDKLQKIACYFGVTVDYLMTGKEESDEFIVYENQANLFVTIRHDKEMLNALEKFYKLSSRQKKHIFELIDLLGNVTQI